MTAIHNRPLISLVISGLLLLPGLAGAQSMGTVRHTAPDGISLGWVFPLGNPSHLGDAALVIENPDESKNIRSGVWFVSVANYRIELINRESYNEPVRVAYGDLDMDGWQDVAVVFRNRPAARLIIGREFAEPRIIEVTLPAAAAWNIGIGDLNSDGLNDLILLDSAQIAILRQNSDLSAGSGSFSLSTTLTTLFPTRANPLASEQILVGDYNGDFSTDFIVNGFLYLNLGRGEFTARELPWRGDSQTIRRLDRVLDADGDGKPELLYVETLSGAPKSYKLVVADYNPLEIFKAGFTALTSQLPLDKAFIEDYNRDGFADLEVLNSANTIFLLAGGKSGIRNASPDSLADTWSGGTLLGLVDPGNAQTLNRLYMNTAADSLYLRYPLGNFLDRTALAGLERKMSGLAVAVSDYDNDGLPDFFVVNGDGANALYRGQPGGKFLEAAASAGIVSFNDGISCAWGDYDNDGFTDLFVAGVYLPDKLFHNNGNGTFSDSSKILRLDRKNQRATSVCWGDINHDGWLDLLIGNFDGANWLLVNRSGRFFEERAAEFGLVEKERTESAVLIDVNVDGWLDIVTLNTEGPTRLLAGGTGGKFTDQTAASGLNPDAVFKKFGQTQNWGDFNGDGFPDLYITRAQDVDMLFLNSGLRGGNRFELKFSDNVNGKYGRIASAIADFNSDGLPDLLIARTSVFGDFYNIPDDLLFFNGPQGWPQLIPANSRSSLSLSPSNLNLQLSFDSSLPVATDFDTDGDLDLLFVNYLPDNSADLFHGSARPLRYIQQQNGFSNTVTVVLKRVDRRGLAGTRVTLAYGGKLWWQEVSGGYGRIQTGPWPFYSLGDTPFADSLIVYWPEGGRQSLAGPIYAGKVEIVVDHGGPGLEILETPGGGEPVVAGPQAYSGTLKVTDLSPLDWLRTIIRHPADGAEDTLTEKISVSGSYRVRVPSPAPGDSLYYYFEAADAYGNLSRLPAAKSSYFKLQAQPGVYLGDLNRDYKINFLDLIRLLQIMAHNGPAPTQYELEAADLNGDGKIDQQDLILLISKSGTSY